MLHAWLLVGPWVVSATLRYYRLLEGADREQARQWHLITQASRRDRRP